MTANPISHKNISAPYTSFPRAGLLPSPSNPRSCLQSSLSSSTTRASQSTQSIRFPHRIWRNSPLCATALMTTRRAARAPSAICALLKRLQSRSSAALGVEREVEHNASALQRAGDIITRLANYTGNLCEMTRRARTARGPSSRLATTTPRVEQLKRRVVDLVQGVRFR